MSMTDPTGRTREWWDDVIGIAHLALTMYRKLRSNRHKGHWRTYGNKAFYIGRLREELEELDTICKQTRDEEMEECADVANFAMMIHERSRLFSVEKPPQ